MDQLYRSNKSVPARVDRAWAQGYQAGRQEWRRIAPVAVVGGAVALLCRRGVSMPVKVLVFYAVLLASILALCALPIVAVVLAVRLWLRHRPAKGELVEWEPFPEEGE